MEAEGSLSCSVNLATVPYTRSGKLFVLWAGWGGNRSLIS